MSWLSLTSQRRVLRLCATVIAVLFVLFLLHVKFATRTPFQYSPLPASTPGPPRNDSDPEGLLPSAGQAPALPAEYSALADQPSYCADRFGITYLEKLRDSKTEYCTPESPSGLTCFHSQTASDYRIDTFCFGHGAVYDPAQQKYIMSCQLRGVDGEGAPPFGKFHNYWYGTGPGVVFQKAVSLQGTLDHTVPPVVSNHTILIQREGAWNVWHSLMEIFSMTMTIDVLRMTAGLSPHRPFFSTVDIANTQVVILDEIEDGPYFDLWKIFAQRPPLRVSDLPPTTEFENLIVPLAGGSNPLWQGDWEIHSCEDSALVRTFSRRVLSHFHVELRRPRQGPQIVLTFIDRRESRKLINQEEYFETVKAQFPHVTVQLIDFARIPFHEQLRIVQGSDILVGVHGAGLTHGIFLPSGSAMVEILPPGLNHKGFRNVASLLGHLYFSAHASKPAMSLTARDDWHADDVYLGRDKFMDIMNVAIKALYNRGERNYDVD
ncbi:DUF563 domain protein [Aspergillus thermomutatus]|uniref:EGF domain-specific O-linked N-acetylglucosamine transferase n=1 Tax=Aspergillus thermomutatus TaxID=41047 RepID=A0A397GG12_ASPTH|nr:uncharacterized protein CDV56_103317 [Aspergillus thermomutatus]RHZ48578.1 hypothetical protein CDV56_103317 [Aspergillus thermomutatus]